MWCVMLQSRSMIAIIMVCDSAIQKHDMWCVMMLQSRSMIAIWRAMVQSLAVCDGAVQKHDIHMWHDMWMCM